MTTDTDLAFTPAYELRSLIASKEVSPVELAELSLRRIEALDSKLNAFLTVAPELALDAARQAEEAVVRGDDLGPLHGVPISIKYLVNVKGLPTTSGSLLFKDRVADQDDVVVQRIKAAGAVIVGKTNVPEFGQSGTTENLLGDHGRNPWNTERVAGGSSGGASSSVAAGITSMAQGSDGGGSIRIPASFCGNYGIKGTAGRVPSPGGGPMGRLPTFRFSVISPVTRTVRDAAILLWVMAGADPDDPVAIRDEPEDYAAQLDGGVKGLRMAWSRDLGSAPVDPEVAETTERAAGVFEELGASVEPAPLAEDVAHLVETFTTIGHSILYLGMGELWEEHGEKMMPGLQARFEHGKRITGHELLRAYSDMERWRSTLDGLFAQYDLLLTPTLAVPAFPCGEWPDVIGGKKVDPVSITEHSGHYPFTYPFNMSQSPAASVPCGFSSDGLPIGLQIVGRKGEESTVFRASAAFEEARPWADKRPPVS